MSVLLEEPRTVLVVGDALPPDEARDLFLDGAAEAVDTAESIAEVTAALDERSDVGCVVTAATLRDGSGIDLCQRVAASHPDVPVVLYVESSGALPVRRAVNAGAAGYFTPADDPNAVRERVDRVLETAVRRLVAVEESDAFRTLLDSIRIPIYVKDAEGRHLRIVDMPEGPDPEEARGKTDLELYDDDTELARSAYEKDMEVVESERPIVDLDERFDLENYEHWSRTTKIPWYGDDGEVKGLVGVSLDVTELKRCQRELDRMRERFDQFANYLSHDLQNPLQVASGNLQIARETGDERAFEKVATALERIEEIVDDLGTLARTDRREAADLPSANLRAVVEDVWGVVETAEASLEVEFGPDARVNEPEGSFRSVLENLLSNAVTHGGADVTVRVGRTETGGLYVADDGPGIPPDRRESVLEHGFTTAEEGTGTGLGIVADVADQNDWRLAITESWAGGARIELEDCLFVWEDPSFAPAGERDLTTESVVGDLQTDPSAAYDPDADAWTLAADGENVWREHNDFYFVHAAADGPVRLTGRVTDVDHVSQYSKAGLMVRTGLDEGASYGGVALTAGRGSELLWRTEADAPGRSYQIGDDDEPFPAYRAEWDGESVTLSVETADGEWIDAAQWPVADAASVEVGLFVCSTVEGYAANARLEDVSVVDLDPEQ